uniref:Uncharacterized protein n=1 Tax=Manihot esculenta TaxID=3983 RepID=A0A2C9W5C5_MANES
MVIFVWIAEAKRVGTSEQANFPVMNGINKVLLSLLRFLFVSLESIIELKRSLWLVKDRHGPQILCSFVGWIITSLVAKQWSVI